MEPLYPHRRRSIVSECGTTFGTRCTVTFQALVHKRLLDENQELRDRLSDALVSVNELTVEGGDTVPPPWRGGGACAEYALCRHVSGHCVPYSQVAWYDAQVGISCDRGSDCCHRMHIDIGVQGVRMAVRNGCKLRLFSGVVWL